MFGALRSLPSVPLGSGPTPVEELTRLRAALGGSPRGGGPRGGGPRLLVKRDDAIPFAFGGNKVRKMRLVAAQAREAGADTLVTTGGVQSNHARVTAAAAAKLGLKCILVANGAAQERPTANALLDRLLGADVRYVASREARAPAMDLAAEEVRRAGGTPFVIPLGASTPLGAAAFVDAIAELRDQIDPPDVILHSTSSGGTQAGLVAGCTLAGWTTRVVGISADASAASLEQDIRGILAGLGPLLGFAPQRFDRVPIEVDDAFTGAGYGIPTAASQEAIELAARREALFLDPTYTAKAAAALVAYVRRGAFSEKDTVLFWHTGGQVGLFA
jgi:1-aminocyclopropane-1-carboxylate deaminase/D-cysteine desulfhydrase-like pyridoxal-dependent ACC family enzyme